MFGQSKLFWVTTETDFCECYCRNRKEENESEESINIFGEENLTPVPYKNPRRQVKSVMSGHVCARERGNLGKGKKIVGRKQGRGQSRIANKVGEREIYTESSVAAVDMSKLNAKGLCGVRLLHI